MILGFRVPAVAFSSSRLPISSLCRVGDRSCGGDVPRGAGHQRTSRSRILIELYRSANEATLGKFCVDIWSVKGLGEILIYE
jgi:hypothetical protein